MKMNEFLKAIGAVQNNDDSKTFDLTTKEGYEDFKNTIKELRNSDTSIFDIFGVNLSDWLDNLSELGDKLHEANNVNKDQKEVVNNAVNQMGRKEIDHSEEPEHKEDVKDQVFNRPSELLSIPQKLQLHKIVQEYVDTVIKPFNNGVLTNDQINDAYAGLYEFGAWILNR